MEGGATSHSHLHLEASLEISKQQHQGRAWPQGEVDLRAKATPAGQSLSQGIQDRGLQEQDEGSCEDMRPQAGPGAKTHGV